MTAAEMRALDRATSEDIGIPAFTLMETAGRAVAECALRVLGAPAPRAPRAEVSASRAAPAGAIAVRTGGRTSRATLAHAAVELLGGRGARVAVVCGPGNNGGDGFVAARVLRDRGADATVYLAAARTAIKGDARAHLEILERTGGVVRALETPAQLAELEVLVDGADLVIDALFGIGVTRPIEGHLAGVIGVMNRAPRRLAVDLPSGLVADTSQAPGAVFDAHRTVTMGALKVALVSAPGFASCGEIEVADIGIPVGLFATTKPRAGLIERADVRGWLPRPAALDHKGTRGHVLVVGGSPGMRGAGRLSATSALRAGAGLVTLAAEPGDDFVAPDSVMTRAVTGALASMLEKKAAVVIGPGLGTGAVARSWLDEVRAAGLPTVLDADALNLVASDPSVLASTTAPVVLTPHPGEATRLLATTTSAIEADRFAAARTLAEKTRAVVVLKGARTVICDGRDARAPLFCAVNPTGGPALATAGSGDVLAGAIGALLAQGLGAFEAAYAAVYVHGLAGERLDAVHGRGAVSSDLPLAIAGVIAQLVA